jgi:hypothetical protein
MLKLRKPILPEWRGWLAIAVAALMLLPVISLAAPSVPPPTPRAPNQLIEASSATNPSPETVADRSAATVAKYTVVLAWFTGVLAFVGMIQGGLFLWQIWLAREEFVATHRPRVVLQRIDTFDRNIGGLAIVVANAGETAAFVSDWYAKVYFQGVEEAFWPQMGTAIERSAVGFWIQPGDSKPLVSNFEADGWRDALFEAGQAEMYVVGTINYSGRDKIARSAGFCRKWFRGNGTWRVQRHSEYEYSY